MHLGNVVCSLAGGVAVYAVMAACSASLDDSGSGDDFADRLIDPVGEARAANDDSSSDGDYGCECECAGSQGNTVPEHTHDTSHEHEAPIVPQLVTSTIRCDVDVVHGGQRHWGAVLELPGKSAAELTGVTAIAPTPWNAAGASFGYDFARATTYVKDGSVLAQCFGEGDSATFSYYE